MNTQTRLLLVLCLLMLPFAIQNLASIGGHLGHTLDSIAHNAWHVLPWVAGAWLLFGWGGCGGRGRSCARKTSEATTDV